MSKIKAGKKDPPVLTALIKQLRSSGLTYSEARKMAVQSLRWIKSMNGVSRYKPEPPEKKKEAA